MMRNKTFFGGEAGVSEGLMYEMFSKPWHCQDWIDKSAKFDWAFRNIHYLS